MISVGQKYSIGKYAFWVLAVYGDFAMLDTLRKVDDILKLKRIQ